MKPPENSAARVALLLLALAATVVALVAAWSNVGRRRTFAEPCVPPVLPEPAECCAGCTPYDAGCGVLACAPGTGIGCGPCPRFE